MPIVAVANVIVDGGAGRPRGTKLLWAEPRTTCRRTALGSATRTVPSGSSATGAAVPAPSSPLSATPATLRNVDPSVVVNRSTLGEPAWFVTGTSNDPSGWSIGTPMLATPGSTLRSGATGPPTATGVHAEAFASLRYSLDDSAPPLSASRPFHQVTRPPAGASWDVNAPPFASPTSTAACPIAPAAPGSDVPATGRCFQDRPPSCDASSVTPSAPRTAA